MFWDGEACSEEDSAVPPDEALFPLSSCHGALFPFKFMPFICSLQFLFVAVPDPTPLDAVLEWDIVDKVRNKYTKGWVGWFTSVHPLQVDIFPEPASISYSAEEECDRKTEEETLTIPSEVQDQLKDPNRDYARGEFLFSDDSSDDDSTTTEEGEEAQDTGEFEWGELDQDAIWDDEEHQVEVSTKD